MPAIRAVPTLLRLMVCAAPLLAQALEVRNADVPPSFEPPPGGGASAQPRGGGLAPLSEYGAGRSAFGAGRQVVVQGLIDLDLLQKSNYTDGNGDASDHRGFGLMRAELGLKIKLDERASAVIGFGYKGELGDYGITNQRPGPPDSGIVAPRQSEQSIAVVRDAYVNLKEFLGYEELAVLAGRQPVDWSLTNQTSDRGSFLFDSRADNPAIGSWDGIKAGYTLETLLVSPWVFRLPDASTLWGITLDWKPVTTSGSDKVFATFSYTRQQNPYLFDGTIGKNLQTYTGGLDWRTGEVGLWFEAAKQRGDAGLDRSFGGWGGEVGLDWQFSQYGKGRFMLIGEILSGDKDPSDGIEAFINTWETVSDTLIVEHEKYGELSGLMPGNLKAVKAKWGVGFDERDQVRFDLTGAYYRLAQVLPSGGSHFGSELDAQLRWQYTYNAQIRLFTGVLKPGGGMTALMTAAGKDASDDLIWIGGVNLNVAF